jgi:prepilin-type N-terminal cleavage/methylation domain-containing protein
MSARKREHGFTLLEVVISASIVAMLAGIAYSLVMTGTSTYHLGTTQSHLEGNAHRVLDAISDALAESSQNVITPVLEPPLGSENVTLQRNTGYSNGAVVWGPVMTFELQYEENDPNDGVDNDGDGLIDEGRIVVTEDPGGAAERTIVLATCVREYLEGETPNGKDDNGNGLTDERGLAISYESGVWTIRVTLERQDAEGRVSTQTVETAVRPRN